jgi:hypothetical protein
MDKLTDKRDLPLFIHSRIDDMTELSPNALRVYMHLCRRADKEGKAWPSYQTVGDHCFSSVSDNPSTRKSFARKAITQLIEAGLLVKEERARDDGGQTSNAYVLVNPPCLISTPVPIDTPMLNKQPPCLIDTPHAYKAPEDTPIEDTPLKKGDEEDTHAGDPVADAWLEHYGEPLPANLQLRIDALVAECGIGAVVYGIKASVEAKARNFRYIAQCARNYVPAVLNGKTNGYSVHLPAAAPSPTPPKAAPPAPAMPGDDLWSIVLAELRRDLPMGFVPTLEGSRLLEAGMVQNADGLSVPLYQVLIAPEQAIKGLTYFQRQCAASIRRSLSSVLHEPVLIEILSDEKEMV